MRTKKTKFVIQDGNGYRAFFDKKQGVMRSQNHSLGYTWETREQAEQQLPLYRHYLKHPKLDVLEVEK